MGIASIPPTKSLEKRINALLKIQDYDDWPVKVVYASKGISPATLLQHLNDFYAAHPNIPLSRRPNFIHVAGSCLIARATGSMTLHTPDNSSVETPKTGDFHLLTHDPDLQAIIWTLHELQQRASASTHILFSYGSFIKRVHGLA